MKLANANPLALLLIGFVLVLLGVVIPFVMVMRWLEPTFFLSFVSWGATVSGLFLGLIGSAYYVKLRKK